MNRVWRLPLIGLVSLLAACQQQQEATPPPPPPKVTVSEPVARRVVESETYTGRLEAVNDQHTVEYRKVALGPIIDGLRVIRDGLKPAGAIAYFTLPVAQYPEVVPPTVVVTATYPGATPDVIADTVVTPIEQEINGVENMLYMSSQSTSDGQMQLTITFNLGTDLN